MRIGLAREIAFYLATDPLPRPRLGDIGEALGVPIGTAIGERLREGRTVYGFDIRSMEPGPGAPKNDWRYFMPYRERERVKKLPAFREWLKTSAPERRAA